MDAACQVSPLTLREAGERLGISWRAAQQLEYRALRKLRREIERQAEAEGVSVRDWIHDSE